VLDRDRPIEVAQQQLGGAHEVELEILLEDARARILRHGEGHGRRIDERGDITEAQGRAPRLDADVAIDAHHRVAGHGGGAGHRLARQRPVVLGGDRAGPLRAVDGDGRVRFRGGVRGGGAGCDECRPEERAGGESMLVHRGVRPVWRSKSATSVTLAAAMGPKL
jgi:hypothetical protein